MKFSLKAKLVLIIEVAVVVVSLACGIASYFILSNVFESRVIAQLQSVTVLKQERITSFIADTTLEIEYVASNKMVNKQLVSLLEKKSVEKQVVYDYFAELQSGEKKFSSLMVLDSLGNVILASERGEEGKIRASEPYFANAMEKTYFQDFSYDASLGTASMMTGTPLRNEKGEFIGVLVGKVNVGEINKLMLERSGLGKTGESVIVNSSNLVITDLLKEPGVALKKTIFNPQIVRCLAGNTFGEKVIDYHGDEVFGYYLWFPQIKACIATKVDTAEALASMQSTYMIMVLICLGIAILAGLIGSVFGGRLFKPLQLLRNEVQKINEGNFDVHVNAASGDEIGEVAVAFNEMAKKLEVSYAELENKVAEKTKDLEDKLGELEKMNELMIGRELTMVEMKKKLQDLDSGK